MFCLHGWAVPIAYAQQAEVQEDKLYLERTMDGELLKQFKEDPELQYEEAVIKEPSWWDLFWMKVFQKLGVFASNVMAGGAYTIITLAILSIVLIYAISRMAGFQWFGAAGSAKAPSLQYSVEEENIHEINFSDEIEAAMQQGNFRRVIRLIYLRSLKELTDKDRIAWKPNKTNADYLSEMKSDPLVNEFSLLDYYFVYSWYGDFDINLAQVERVRNVSDQMRLALNKS